MKVLSQVYSDVIDNLRPKAKTISWQEKPNWGRGEVVKTIYYFSLAQVESTLLSIYIHMHNCTQKIKVVSQSEQRMTIGLEWGAGRTRCQATLGCSCEAFLKIKIVSV